ncbi:MAG: phosphoenolpyruvate carboxylase, partial [Planctomycetota bacterium]
MGKQHRERVDGLMGMFEHAVGSAKRSGASIPWHQAERAADLCRTEDEADLADAVALVKSLSDDEISSLMAALTLRFHLVNKAEQLTIASINRERECNATEHSPKPESIAEAVVRLQRGGRSLGDVLHLLGTID